MSQRFTTPNLQLNDDVICKISEHYHQRLLLYVSINFFFAYKMLHYNDACSDLKNSLETTFKLDNKT